MSLRRAQSVDIAKNGISDNFGEIGCKYLKKGSADYADYADDYQLKGNAESVGFNSP